MSPHADHILAEALRLPEQERGDLAVRLIESLDPTVEENVEAAWDTEIQNRLQELETGQVQPVPWAEARRQILEEKD